MPPRCKLGAMVVCSLLAVGVRGFALRASLDVALSGVGFRMIGSCPLGVLRALGGRCVTVLISLDWSMSTRASSPFAGLS